MKKKFVFTIALVLGAMVLAGCGKKETASDTWADLEARGTVIVGLDDTFVPMGFKDENGQMTGFDVELAVEALGRMGLEPVFQPIDWNLKETELSSKNIDLIWNGYTITEERREKVNFTTPYLDNQQSIVVLAGSDIMDKAALEGRAVATQNSSSALAAIEAEGAMEAFKDGNVVLFDTYNDAFMDLEAGRVDAVVADEILARYYIATRGEAQYRVLEEDFGDEEYGVGVRKGDETLLEKLNEALDAMKADGSAAAISEKWFGENIVK
ncbi:amino acid ABC transporter substrate-binding protein [Anaerotalea alkaliphila]|uniref:Amino acid ABC transporter substrate-binding protein n=1 Tax=Anaerotalea alkaliphila TaxID=2662126 RepID=A0A7X5KL10_9FIRM|nr:amino acid ABC transporter substrate-binding protein [Anaerotalea alkaliphila]NDL66214.1 amino acid ABC transporter substrate-binding protein [Anaerotalea alkaliphila]